MAKDEPLRRELADFIHAARTKSAALVDGQAGHGPSAFRTATGCGGATRRPRSLWPQFATHVLEGTNQLFLLGVNRDGRLPGGDLLLHLVVQILELRVPIRMLATFAGLPQGLETIAERMQHASDRVLKRMKRPGTRGGYETLLARIRAVLRRRAPEQVSDSVTIGALVLDAATHRVTWQGQTLKVQFLPIDMNDDLQGGMTLRR